MTMPDVNDDQLYEQALEEFDGGKAAKSTLARALVEANGDDARTRAAYIRLRVAQLSSEREIERVEAERIAKAEAEQRKESEERKGEFHCWSCGMTNPQHAQKCISCDTPV